MFKIENIAVIGGDIRQLYLAERLAADGYKVGLLGFDNGILPGEEVSLTDSVSGAVKQADCVILPLITTNDSLTVLSPFSDKTIALDEVMETADPSRLILGGMLPPDLVIKAGNKHQKLIDYYEREELVILNAIPTAEGAIAIAMTENDFTVFGSRCLVCGYGRLGKILASTLKCMGADVTVAARKYSDFAWIKAAGIKPRQIKRLAEYVHEFDTVYNTVPAKLFNGQTLCKVGKDTLIIDLASRPGGLDFEKARGLGVKFRRALSLPGKTAPRSAAGIIYDTVINIIEEESL